MLADGGGVGTVGAFSRGHVGGTHLQVLHSCVTPPQHAFLFRLFLFFLRFSGFLFVFAGVSQLRHDWVFVFLLTLEILGQKLAALVEVLYGVGGSKNLLRLLLFVSLLLPEASDGHSLEHVLVGLDLVACRLLFLRDLLFGFVLSLRI